MPRKILVLAGSEAQADRLPHSHLAQGITRSSTVQMPAAAQPLDRQDPCAGVTGARAHETVGRQADSQHRPGAGELCDDADNRLLQSEAPDFHSAQNRNRGLLSLGQPGSHYDLAVTLTGDLGSFEMTDTASETCLSSR